MIPKYVNFYQKWFILEQEPVLLFIRTAHSQNKNLEPYLDKSIRNCSQRNVQPVPKAFEEVFLFVVSESHKFALAHNFENVLIFLEFQFWVIFNKSTLIECWLQNKFLT